MSTRDTLVIFRFHFDNAKLKVSRPITRKGPWQTPT